MGNNKDFALERRMREADPGLSKRYTDCIVVLTVFLEKYTKRFPFFTDHTLSHGLSVLNYANQIMGNYASNLNADEVYCFLMGVAVHDLGMGINEKNFEEFKQYFGIDTYMKNNPDLTLPDVIRNYHNDLSYAFVMKYWDLFDIPDISYAKAIALIGRGHRRTDLFDGQLYPNDYLLYNGSVIRLPMLSALLRLADELDLGSERNPEYLYRYVMEAKMPEISKVHMKRHKSIDSIVIEDTRIVFMANTQFPEVKDDIIQAVEDVRKKLKYLREVSFERPCFPVDQDRIVLYYGDEVIEFPA